MSITITKVNNRYLIAVDIRQNNEQFSDIEHYVFNDLEAVGRFIRQKFSE